MQQANCLIVDDEPLARKLMAAYCAKIPQLEVVGQCASAMDAQFVLHEKQVDIMLLDIQMPDLSGPDFLRSIARPPLVIFTTAYSEYALQGFELDAVDYLVKPIAFDRFFKATNKAIRMLQLRAQAGAQPPPSQPKPPPGNAQDTEAREKQHIFVKSDYKIVKIAFDDLLFLQSVGDYVRIYTQHEKIITLQPLLKFEEGLPANRFFRIHRSYIVNLEKINSIEGNSVIIGSHRLSVSKRQKKEFLERLDVDGLLK